MEEINKEYFDFANSTIITMLTNIRATWCKVLTQEKTEANDAFLQAWTPPSHIITFRSYLEKHQKLCKAIDIPIRNTDKILFFVVHMYASKHLTEEEMTKYEMTPNNDKDSWIKNLAYLINLYTMQKPY